MSKNTRRILIAVVIIVNVIILVSSIGLFDTSEPLPTPEELETEINRDLGAIQDEVRAKHGDLMDEMAARQAQQQANSNDMAARARADNDSDEMIAGEPVVEVNYLKVVQARHVKSKKALEAALKDQIPAYVHCAQKSFQDGYAKEVAFRCDFGVGADGTVDVQLCESKPWMDREFDQCLKKVLDANQFPIEFMRQSGKVAFAMELKFSNPKPGDKPTE